MKEMIKIVLGLCVTCITAACIMGVTFIFTSDPKKKNEHINFEKNMFNVLGYNENRSIPADLKLYSIFRYIIIQGDNQYLGYAVPVGEKDSSGYDLLQVDTNGNFVDHKHLDIKPEKVMEEGDRTSAIKAAVGGAATVTYADMFFVAKVENKRSAFLLPAETIGFKTTIGFMLALDPLYNVIGVEILEHEEDPGLGAEIEQEYFKNQFQGKSFEKVKSIVVIKQPIPDDYLKFLEKKKWRQGEYSEQEIKAMQQKYQDSDINAITGATISSVALTNGIKVAVKKFVYRVKVLDTIIMNKQIAVAF
ncbi:MAG: FMN-binding protein [Desulfobacterales bacterium]|nr:FMN-binding protein [Desulfobacterales bacterium]